MESVLRRRGILRTWNVPFDILPDYSGELLEVSHSATFVVKTKTFKSELRITTPLRVITSYSDGISRRNSSEEAVKLELPRSIFSELDQSQVTVRKSGSTVNMSDSTSFDECLVLSKRIRAETTFTFLSMEATYDENESS